MQVTYRKRQTGRVPAPVSPMTLQLVHCNKKYVVVLGGAGLDGLYVKQDISIGKVVVPRLPSMKSPTRHGDVFVLANLVFDCILKALYYAQARWSGIDA
jgi:hypothetical protein